MATSRPRSRERRAAQYAAPLFSKRTAIRLCDLFIRCAVLFLLGAVPLILSGRYSALNIKEAVFQFIMMPTLMAFFIRSLLVGHIKLPRCPHWSLLGMLLLWSFVSLSYTPAKRTSIRDFVLTACALALLALFAIYLRKRRFRKISMLMMVLSATLVALGSNCQYNNIFMGILPRTSPDSIDRTWVCSTIGHNNGVAVLMMLSSFAVLSLLLAARTRLVKAFGFLVLAFLYFLILICQTRAVWIAVPIGTLLFFVIAFRDHLKGEYRAQILTGVLGGAIALLALAFLYYALTGDFEQRSNIPTIRERLSHFSPEILIVNTRTRIMSIGAFMIKDHPILGHGFNSFKYIYPKYQGDYFARFPNSPLDPTGRHTDRAHNDFLQLWVEKGLPGLLLGLWILLVHLKVACREVSERKPFQTRLLLAASIGATVSLLIVNTASFEFRVVTSAIALIFWIGLFLQLASRGRPYTIPLGAYGTKPWLRNSAMFALLILATYGCLYTTRNIMSDHYYVRGKIFRDRGYALVESGKVDEGIKHVESGAAYFKLAVQLGPYYGLVHYELAQVLGKIGEMYLTKKRDARTAERFLHEATYTMAKAGREYQYKGNYYVIGKAHAFLYYMNKHPQEGELAERNFRLAFRIYPRDTNARDQLGRFYWYRGEKEKAFEEWRQIMVYEPDFHRTYHLMDGIRAEEIGVTASAEQSYQIVIALAPHEIEAWDRLAHVYVQSKRFEEAYRVYEDYWKTHGEHLPILGQYYRICLKAGDEERLNQVLSRAMEITPVIALRILFHTCLDMKEYAKAEHVLEQLSSLPQSPRAERETRWARMELFWRTGRVPELLQAWRDMRGSEAEIRMDEAFFLAQYLLHVPIMTLLPGSNCM